ncbi:MAG: NTP transferase domain-containing protein [Chloroflexi bacterium]|nr:NTP transferase domain-containing protein [Chloroflexota bacterium]
MADNPLQVVILAAAQHPGTELAGPRALQRLGDKTILDHVIELAQQITQPEHIYLVVGYQHQMIEEYLGSRYHYVLQEQQLGTGHAVLQMRPYLAAGAGNLMILYGDTPLFRLSSLKGMLLRHTLKGAAFTFLTRETDQPLPYGRVVRDASGSIQEIIEEADATQTIRHIRELNLGAYIARTDTLVKALCDLDCAHGATRNQLPAAVKWCVANGLKVETYPCADPDEVLGINTPENLEQAALILQKRVMRPRLIEEQNIIRFGTGGWRAIISEGFTMHNVRRLSQALANRLIRQNCESQGVLIGYDHRFLSDNAACAAAEVMAGNGIRAILLREAAPTPLITFATALEHTAYGLAFTASHNPPEWNGLKVFKQDGSLLLDDESSAIETEANALAPEDVIKIELPLGLEAGRITYGDFTNAYVDAVERFIDMAAIREAGLHVVVDPMYGVGELTINYILAEARCRVTTIHGQRDPLFGGRSPAPDSQALRLLVHTIVDNEGTYDIGLAMDGDADRIAIVDEHGSFITMNDLLVLVYWYLHEFKGQSGAVVRNLATTHMLDRIARLYHEECIEVPVGFKHITKGMLEHNAVLGGESSGGLTIRGHILGKDGILAAALVVEMLARTGRRITQLLSDVFSQIGRLYSAELNVAATPEMKVLFPRYLQQHRINAVAGYPVRSISTTDGTKLILDNDQWVLLRFSGTEPLLRIFVEADTPDKAQQLLMGAQRLLPLA